MKIIYVHHAERMRTSNPIKKLEDITENGI